MGAGQLKDSNLLKMDPNSLSITHNRLMNSHEAAKLKWKSKDQIRLQPFQRLWGWELELEGITVTPPDNTLLTSDIYFQDQQSLEAYLGYMVSLKQLCHLNLYDDFDIQIDKTPFCITTKQQLMGIPKPIDRLQLKKNVEKFLHLLSFLSQLLVKAQNIFIIPEDIVQLNNQFYLRGFLHKDCPKKKLIMAYIVWLFEQYDTFDECLQVDNTVSSFNTLDRYVKQIFFTIKNNRIDDEDMIKYFKSVCDKMKYLDGGFDSFHVCYKSKRSKYNTGNTKEWLLAKKSNQIYFFNIDDQHVCQGRVMRKSKKINVEHTHIIFNSTDFQVNFVLQGTKNMVKTTEFELEDCFTISDIQIKYKFPFKIRNPLMFLRGRELYMLDQMIYRYSIDENKLYQQSKKINDCLYIVPSVDFNYVVIRHSIDIFRYGVKIYTSDRYDTLMPSGNAEMGALMENVKIDIKHIEFCSEVYKGVFLMLADKNFWILDLNFMCFFSYSSLQRIHSLFKGKGSELQANDYIFQTLGQPFSMHWLSHQHGLNVHVHQDILHVIANVNGKLFYLQYRFIFQAGLLKLIKYRPLYQQKLISTDEQPEVTLKNKESYFNVYNESLLMYKNTSWIHKGSIFLEAKKMRMALCKNFTQIFVETDETTKNIRDIIEENRKIERRWSKIEITILLYKILSMMCYLNQNNIAYKNFSLANLWITARRQLKMVGWSEPQRNWHISDFKDYLLASFNVITQNNYEKLNDKFLSKHQAELQLFPVLRDKIQLGVRNKMPEKRADADKQLMNIKESLNQEIYRFIQPHKSSNFIFSFQKNTPRFSMLYIAESKLKKMVAIIQSHNAHQQFTFKENDEYAWSDQQNCLYVLTAAYQMYQIKPNIEDYKEETIVVEEYEYLPNNIVDFSFISCERGLYAIGGISRNSKKKVQYNLNVYHFNRNKLTWQAVAQLNSARTKPSLVLSETGRYIYVMNGQLDQGSEELSMFAFDTVTSKIEWLVDLGFTNPFKKMSQKNAFKLFHLSEKYNIFLMWSVSATNYQFKLFSTLIAGFQIDFQGKIYLQEGAELPSISIAFSDGAIHFLRPYGKYSKITIEGLQNPKIINKTLYLN